jgi:hypothetical protein
MLLPSSLIMNIDLRGVLGSESEGEQQQPLSLGIAMPPNRAV